ncbi:TRAP transporter small permease subunit [Chloroflexi bacterium TSY]|nr:TRAP transporter small permease subunit [Chloroflexi bacterium TSY]
MNGLINLSRRIDRFSDWIGTISVYLVIITVALTFYNVVVRYLGQYIGTQLSFNTFLELQWHFYSLVFFLSFAYILKHGINVRVDFIYAHWPTKRKALLDFVGHLLFLVPFCLLAIWVTINPVLTAWGRLPNGGWGPWEQSPDPGGLPRAPIKTMIIIAFVLLLLQTFSELVKLWVILRGHEELVETELDTESPLRIE